MLSFARLQRIVALDKLPSEVKKLECCVIKLKPLPGILSVVRSSNVTYLNAIFELDGTPICKYSEKFILEYDAPSSISGKYIRILLSLIESV